MPVKFSLVIPTYNESFNIVQLCRRIISSLEETRLDFEIIIVDDDSCDLTWKIAGGLAAHDSRIRVIRRFREKGLAHSVVDGWKESRGEILGVIDGDLQHPPEALQEMIGRILCLPGPDIVIASRYVEGGNFSGGRWQRIKSRLAIFLGKMVFPGIFSEIKDPMSGFFIFRKEVISGLSFNPLGYKILLEVLVCGHYKKVEEMPYEFRLRRQGKSNSGWKQCILYILHLLRLRMKRGILSRVIKQF
jgi:dolichol-phosphate mannosyltransferase